MKKLIVDFEMCQSVRLDDGTLIREIIEIGAVLLNENNEIIEEYSRYVKPIYGKLTPFITRLTGITQENLDTGTSIEEVINDLNRITNNFKECTFSTWSPSDLNELRTESKVKGINIDNIEEVYDDIQKLFCDKLNYERQVGLKVATEMMGLDFDGREHSALADAKNTARVYVQLKDNKLVDKVKLSKTYEPLTSSLGSMFDFSKFL